jgi:hypothetical protein
MDDSEVIEAKGDASVDGGTLIWMNPVKISHG